MKPPKKVASIFTETPGYRCRSRYVYDEAKIRREGVKQSYNCGEISNKTKYGNFPLLAETAGPPHVCTGFYKFSTETITTAHSSCSTCWKHLVVNHRLNWSGWVSSLWPLNNYVQIVETYSSPLISRLEVVQDGNLRPPQNLFNLAWSAVLVP